MRSSRARSDFRYVDTAGFISTLTTLAALLIFTRASFVQCAIIALGAGCVVMFVCLGVNVEHNSRPGDHDAWMKDVDRGHRAR